MATPEAGQKPIRFKVAFEGKPEKAVDSMLYAFDRQGGVLASAALRDGDATLSLAPDQLRRARLFVAPKLPEGRAQPTLKMMALINAYEPAWRFEPRRDVYELLPIPEQHWRLWYWCSCRVRGRVIKVETLGGVTYENPVCHARIHICEVDRIPWIIAQLPDPVIWRLRDELLQAIERPIPIPNPPDPPFDPGFIDPLPPIARAANVFRTRDPSAVSLNPQPEPPGQVRQPRSISRAGMERVALNPQPLPPGPPEARMAIGRSALDRVALNPQPLPPRAIATTLPIELRSTLMSRSISLVREALIKNPHLIWPYWCEWDWLTPYLWPHFFYHCDELAVVETDGNGRFDTTIWYPCFGDKPDLYFWVEYSLGGAWVTVYHPPIRCHTHWNYACGTEVTIRITDPRVHGCGDRPEVIGKKLVVKTIGRQVSMGEIYRESADAVENAKAGLVKEGWIHFIKPSPFGDELEPRVDFGNGLKTAGITHYRWSFRALGSTSEADWQVVDKQVSRHYRETTPPGAPIVYKPLQIGPDPAVTVGYYTIIDPVLPPGGEDWEILDEGYDLASAFFNTLALSPGKYELKLELFRKVGAAMTRVDDLVAEGIEIYEITDPAPLIEGSYTTTAPTEDRKAKDPVTHKVIGYRLVVHVDNDPCFCTIDDVTVNGSAAGQCGFLEYDDLINNAHISFRASQPANFAWADFGVVRVATPIGEASANGLVDAASINGFVRAGNTFGKDISIGTLMTSGLADGEIPCTRAAFAEALHVYATATNGYGRLSGLDAPHPPPPQVSLKAFAITPAEPPT